MDYSEVWYRSRRRTRDVRIMIEADKWRERPLNEKIVTKTRAIFSRIGSVLKSTYKEAKAYKDK